MKRSTTLVIAFLMIGITGLLVLAQQAWADSTAQNKIRTLGVMGYGIAISQSDPMNFEFVKIGVAEVDVNASGIEKTVKVGILYFGNDKYILKDAVIGNGTAAANIYQNDTQKGSVSLNSYIKREKEVWAGTLTLNEQTYNMYVLQVQNIWKPAEKADKIKEYCDNNPVKCKAVVKAVGGILCDPEKEGASCRDKIKTFCEQQPDDNRCKVLGIAYCRLHLEDANCRQALIDKCKENSTDAGCDKLVNVYNNIEKRTGNLIKNAPNWLKSVKARIATKTQAEINSEDGTIAADTGANPTGGQ